MQHYMLCHNRESNTYSMQYVVRHNILIELVRQSLSETLYNSFNNSWLQI